MRATRDPLIRVDAPAWPPYRPDDPQEQLRRADVIFLQDERTGDGFPIYGVETLDRFLGDGRGYLFVAHVLTDFDAVDLYDLASTTLFAKALVDDKPKPQD